MHVLLLGGTGRTGRLVAPLLRAQGHAVTVAGRRDPQLAGCHFRSTDLQDAAALRAAAEGHDAVVSALAAAKGNPVCSAVARALAPRAGLRYVTIAGAAVDAPGDAKGAMDRFVGWVVRRVDAEMVADRQAELATLQASGLRWTMLRPPRLTDAPASGRVRISFDRPASTAIGRADLAQTVCQALRDDALVGRAPFVAG